MDANKTGKIIKDARLAKNMTQKELADKISVSTFAVSKWENGRGMPDISYLQPIASTLDVSLNELILGEKQMTTLKDDATVKQLINEAVKQSKRKIFRTSMCIVVSIIVVVSSFLSYWYYRPDVYMFIKPFYLTHEELSYVERPEVTVITHFRLSIPQKLRDNINDFNQKNNLVASDVVANYVGPYAVKCNVEVKDGKTIVTYTGTTKNRDYYKQLVFDYVIAEKTSDWFTEFLLNMS